MTRCVAWAVEMQERLANSHAGNLDRTGPRTLVRQSAVRARPAVRCRRSRDDLPREREVGDAAGRGDRLDVVGILEGLQTVPDADAAAEHERDLDEMHVVDEPGGEEVAYDGGPAADPDVLAIGCFAGGLERLGRGAVEEWNVVPPSISIEGRGR
jgi:hypothetical protein